MNVRQTKKPEQRIDVRYLSSLGIKTYGDNNLYPQQVRDIVQASPTGRTCVERRATYLEGDGLRSRILADAVCNVAGDTFDDVHHLCAGDYAFSDGIALHVNYNLLGQIVSLACVPFENCRLEEEDEEGVIGHVVVHPDWRGKKTRGGKAIKVNVDTIELFPVFNPDPAVVQQQIMASGGIEFYKGQILYVSNTGRLTYPLPQFDAALTDMSTEEGLVNVNQRNVRNGFLPGGMLVIRKGQNTEDNDPRDNDGFASTLETAQGDMNTQKIFLVEVETDEEVPKFIPFVTNNYDKEFTVTTNTVVDNIYAAFNQEAFGRLRKGSIGFSGELVGDVKLEYCEHVKKQQRILARAYKAILDHWAPGIVPYAGAEDVRIEPLIKSINDGTTPD